MDEPDRKPRLLKIAPTAARGFVQRARSLASARDQDGQLSVAAFRRNLEEFRAHGQPRNLRFSGREKARGIRETQQRAVNEPADLAIGQARHRIRLHHNQRRFFPQRRQHHRPRRIAAQAEHRRRLMLLQQLDGAQHAERKLGERAKLPQHAHPVQAANFDELERKTRRRHQLRLKAVARADEDRLMAVGLQLSRHREQRHHVPTRPSAGHHDCCHPCAIAQYPECSLTLSNIPRQMSVLISELPPALIIGSGMPLVGPMPSTTLMLISA